MLALILAAAAALATHNCKDGSVVNIHTIALDNIPTSPGSINGRPVQIMIDTGTGVSRTSEVLLSTIKATTFGHTDLNGIGDQKTYEGDVIISGFHLGSIEVGIAPELPQSTKVGGIIVLGMAALDKFGIVLDLGRNQVSLVDQQACPLSSLVPGGRRVPRTQRRRYVMHIDVLVNGARSDAMLDTGASYTVFSAEAAKKLGVNILNSDAGQAHGGVESSVAIGSVPLFEVAGTKYLHHRVLVSSQLDGIQSILIGSDILSNFVVGMSSRSSDDIIFRHNEPKLDHVTQ